MITVTYYERIYSKTDDKLANATVDLFSVCSIDETSFNVKVAARKTFNPVEPLFQYVKIERVG